MKHLDLNYGRKVMFNRTSRETLHSNVKYWCIQNPTRTIIIAARGVRRSTSSCH